MRGIIDSNQASPESKGKPNDGLAVIGKSETSLSETSEESEEVTSIKSLDELLHIDRINYQPYTILFDDPQEMPQTLEMMAANPDIVPSKKAKKKKTKSKAILNKFGGIDEDESNILCLVRSKSQPILNYGNSSEDEEDEEGARMERINFERNLQVGKVSTAETITPRGKEVRGKSQKQDKVLSELQLTSPEREKESSQSSKARVSSAKNARLQSKKEKESPYFEEEKLARESNDLDLIEDYLSGEEESKRKDSYGNEELKDEFLPKRESVGDKENDGTASKVMIRWCSNCDLIVISKKLISP